jgi:hypothetical protein
MGVAFGVFDAWILTGCEDGACGEKQALVFWSGKQLV